MVEIKFWCDWLFVAPGQQSCGFIYWQSPWRFKACFPCFWRPGGLKAQAVLLYDKWITLPYLKTQTEPKSTYDLSMQNSLLWKPHCVPWPPYPARAHRVLDSDGDVWWVQFYTKTEEIKEIIETIVEYNEKNTTHWKTRTNKYFSITPLSGNINQRITSNVRWPTFTQATLKNNWFLRVCVCVCMLVRLR